MPLADAWTDWALITKWYLELVSGGENGGEQVIPQATLRSHNLVLATFCVGTAAYM